MSSPQKHSRLLEHGVGGASKTQGYILQSFELVKEFADSHSIQVYNATRGGLLEVFPRVVLEDVLRNKVQPPL